MSTTASLVVSFGDVDNAYLTAEFNNDKNGGRSTFQAGEKVYFKVYANCNYEIKVTDGIIHDGPVNVSEDIRDEIIQFIATRNANLSKKVVSIDTETWYGPNNFTPLIIMDGSTVKASGNPAIPTEDVFAIMSINYKTEYNEHWLEAPTNMPNKYAILILITAVA